MRKYLIVAAGALALMSCGKKSADADGDGKISDAEVKAEMASGGALPIKAGLWEIKVALASIEGAGITPDKAKMMREQAGAQTIRSCITEEQVKKPGSDFFGTPASANCTFEELTRTGSAMKVAMTCKPAGAIVLKSKLTGNFAAETYTLDMEQTTEGVPTGPVKTKGKIEGRRVGDCPA